MEKVIVKANIEQLDFIGIDQPITGLEGVVTHDYGDSWTEIEVEYDYIGHKVKNRFDIYKKWLQNINELNK